MFYIALPHRLVTITLHSDGTGNTGIAEDFQPVDQLKDDEGYDEEYEEDDDEWYDEEYYEEEEEEWYEEEYYDEEDAEELYEDEYYGEYDQDADYGADDYGVDSYNGKMVYTEDNHSTDQDPEESKLGGEVGIGAFAGGASSTSKHTVAGIVVALAVLLALVGLFYTRSSGESRLIIHYHVLSLVMLCISSWISLNVMLADFLMPCLLVFRRQGSLYAKIGVQKDKRPCHEKYL